MEKLKLDLTIQNGKTLNLKVVNDINLNLTTELMATVIQTVKSLSED